VITEDDLIHTDEGKQHFSLYLMVQTFIVTFFCVPALAFIREMPPSPPSVVANDTNNSMSIGEGLRYLLANKNYILLFICYNFIYGVQTSMGGIYANLAGSFGYSLTSNSLSCLLFLVGGIFNSFFLGSLLDKYQNYRKMITLISLLSLITTLLHFGTLSLHNPMLEATAMLLIGISVIPISSVAFTFSVELAFPVPEALTNGMMITVSLIWGTAMGFLCSSLAEKAPIYALTFWSASALCALGISFFIKEDLRRLQLDDVKNSEYIEEEEVRR
jgi:sugar phosphate permease